MSIREAGGQLMDFRVGPRMLQVWLYSEHSGREDVRLVAQQLHDALCAVEDLAKAKEAARRFVNDEAASGAPSES